MRPFLIGALALPIAAVGCNFAATSGDFHSMGLLVTSEAAYAGLPLALPPAASFLPASADLSADFPAPGDQGRQDSCVAWAAGYALKSYQERVDKAWSLADDSHLMSPSFIFNQIKAGDGSIGSYMEDALNLLLIKGVCSLATMPYDFTDDSRQPSPAAFAEAASYKISSWSRINQDSVADIKGFILDGKPVLVGIKVFHDFDTLSPSNPVYDSDAKSSRGSHAIVLLGYDDSMQAFKFINSWGKGWGLGGYGWLAYALVPSAVISGYVAVDAAP
jgi:C1A family cysteine protease